MNIHPLATKMAAEDLGLLLAGLHAHRIVSNRQPCSQPQTLHCQSNSGVLQAPWALVHSALEALEVGGSLV